MPIVEGSAYRPPAGFSNPHFQTMWQSALRRVRGTSYSRERIDTPDGDFLDLDWLRGGNERLVIILHGMEASSGDNHVRGLARAFLRAGWDVLAPNLRGCSGVPNRLARSYNAGLSGDLDLVVRHALAGGAYGRLDLAGFSLGGNIVLKYLGERGRDLPDRLARAAAVSVPCDLAASAWKLDRPENRFYLRRFMRKFRARFEAKLELFPAEYDRAGLAAIRDFKALDERYTAPQWGFAGAEAYWAASSCKGFLAGIRLPTLLLSALDDPFLTPDCFPREQAAGHEFLHLETPAHGGHCGFLSFDGSGESWLERRLVSFISQGPPAARKPGARAAARLVVIADDLTGALDTGVQFAGGGRGVELRIEDGRAAGPRLAGAAAVLVIDTESRHALPAEAGRRVEEAARAAAGGSAGGQLIFYKKTDSSLRGNIGAELEGLMRAVPGLPLVFAPAYPKLDRTTSGGLHYIAGVPVAASSFGRDPLNPVLSSSVAEIVAGQTGRELRLTGPAGLPELLAGGFEGIALVDAETEADLELAAAGLAGRRPLPLLAGCAGFAAHLDGLTGVARRPSPAEKPPAMGGLPRPFLLVNGSLNPASLVQLKAALEAGFADVALSPEELIPDRGAEEAALESTLARLERALAAGKTAVLRSVADRSEFPPYRERASARGWGGAELHQAAAGYARSLAGLLERRKIGTLAVFGGDTLLAILDALGRPAIVPLGELEPGLVLARLAGRDNPARLVTKAGGFGDERLLLRLAGLAGR